MAVVARRDDSANVVDFIFPSFVRLIYRDRYNWRSSPGFCSESERREEEEKECTK